MRTIALGVWAECRHHASSDNGKEASSDIVSATVTWFNLRQGLLRIRGSGHPVIKGSRATELRWMTAKRNQELCHNGTAGQRMGLYVFVLCLLVLAVMWVSCRSNVSTANSKTVQPPTKGTHVFVSPGPFTWVRGW